MLEAVVAIAAGAVAGSVALVGFGLDSVVEVSSGLVILWQFRHRLPETRERQALRLIGVSFFALAAYVTVESLRALLGDARPDTSPLGIALAATSLVVMPFLSWAQRRTGRALGSGSVVADSEADAAVHVPVRGPARAGSSSTPPSDGRGQTRSRGSSSPRSRSVRASRRGAATTAADRSR